MEKISETLAFVAGITFFVGMFIYAIADTTYGMRVVMDCMLISAVTGTTSYVFSQKAKEM